MKFSKLNRDVHRWGSIAIALPLIIIIVTGVILQLKKEADWIQPPTQRGESNQPTIGFAKVLKICKRVPEGEISSWDDIDRVDVRPGKGMLKVRCKNEWEIQLDAQSGEVLQIAYRRSDWIESLHDGSFFHDRFKLWVFLPVGVTLALLWISGLVLFFLPYWARYRNKRRRARAG